MSPWACATESFTNWFAFQTINQKVTIMGIRFSDSQIHTRKGSKVAAEVPHSPNPHLQCWALQGQGDPHWGGLYPKAENVADATAPAPWNSQFLLCDPLQTRGSICDVTRQAAHFIRHCPAPAAPEESSANLIMSTGGITEVSSSAEQ